MSNLRQPRRVDESSEQHKTRLAALRQRRRVKELPEQRETRFAADRVSKKKNACRCITKATRV